MISELQIDDAERICIPWWNEVKWLKDRESISFEPGLNVLWGPNGSGKSTVIRCLARMLHAEQGGRSVVTETSIRQLFDRVDFDSKEQCLDGAKPVHDGQAVIYFDPSNRVGLTAYGGGIDWDFGSQGLANVLFKGSAGQTTLKQFNKGLAALVKPSEWPDIQWKGMSPDGEGVNSLWTARCKHVKEILDGTLPEGQRTMLLDEPDRSLDLPYQAGLWDRLAEAAENTQIIAASHSLLALELPGANYIELEEGYLDQSREILIQLMNRM